MWVGGGEGAIYLEKSLGEGGDYTIHHTTNDGDGGGGGTLLIFSEKNNYYCPSLINSTEESEIVS